MLSMLGRETTKGFESIRFGNQTYRLVDFRMTDDAARANRDEYEEEHGGTFKVHAFHIVGRQIFGIYERV